MRAAVGEVIIGGRHFVPTFSLFYFSPFLAKTSIQNHDLCHDTRIVTDELFSHDLPISR